VINRAVLLRLRNVGKKPEGLLRDDDSSLDAVASAAALPSGGGSGAALLGGGADIAGASSLLLCRELLSAVQVVAALDDWSVAQEAEVLSDTIESELLEDDNAPSLKEVANSEDDNGDGEGADVAKCRTTDESVLCAALR
jgi:hypothetical protein